MPSTLFRLLSHLAPIRLERAEGKHGPLELTLEHGRMVVNSANANQSFGSLHRVWQACADHFLSSATPPASVLVLGLGTGSIVRILRRDLGWSSPITAVEDDPLMVQWGRTHFGLGDQKDLSIMEQDVRQALPALPATFDLVVVDLFLDLDMPAFTAEEAFHDAVRARTAIGGTVLFNTIVHDAPSRQRSERIGTALRLRFGRVEEQGYEGMNRVFIAR